MQNTPPVIPPAKRGRRRTAAPSPVPPAAPPLSTPPPAALADGGFVAVADERQVVSLAGLTRKAGAYLPKQDLRRIREAYRFSDEAHLGQFRSSGAPYISHPIAVAEILCGWKLDALSLIHI